MWLIFIIKQTTHFTRRTTDGFLHRTHFYPSGFTSLTLIVNLYYILSPPPPVTTLPCTYITSYPYQYTITAIGIQNYRRKVLYYILAVDDYRVKPHRRPYRARRNPLKRFLSSRGLGGYWPTSGQARCMMQHPRRPPVTDGTRAVRLSKNNNNM